MNDFRDFMYQSIFIFDGEEKAKAVISQFKNKGDINTEDLENFVFISVGGADGGEACHFIGNTPCKHAILIEYSETACNSARTKDYYLHKTLKKRLYTVKGDAGRTIGVGVALARKILKEEILPKLEKTPERPYGIIWSY